MKQKKSCAEICLTPLNLYFKSENEYIQNLIEKLSLTKDFGAQQDCIKQFADYLQSSLDNDCKKYVLQMLAFLFISTAPKHAIKKTIARILQYFKDNDVLANLFSESFKLLLADSCDNFKDPSKAVTIKEYFIIAMASSLEVKAVVPAVAENIDLIFNFTFELLSEAVDCLWERRSPVKLTIMQQHSCAYNATKFLLTILQKCKVGVIDEQNRLKLITVCYDIMVHKHAIYDTKSNCGHIIVLLFTGLPDNFIDDCPLQKYPYLEFLKFGQEPSTVLEKVGIKDIEDKVIFETFKVCIYVGILIVASQDALWQYKIDDEHTLSYMFKELSLLAKNVKGNPTQIMGIAKAISIMSSYLNHLAFDKLVPLFTDGLNYVIMFLDDRIENVRNHTKIIFENLIKLALKHNEEGKGELLGMIMQWLKDLPDCSTRYTGLIVLCSQMGCVCLLKDIPDLAQQLINEMVQSFTKAYNICFCYESLMQAHLKEVDSKDDWINYWVSVIIKALKTSEPPLTAFIQKLFAAAFKMQPTALKALTQQRFLNTTNELGAFLGCIRIARKMGLNIPVETLYTYQIDQKNTWRNLLDCSTLEILQTHQDDEIRILVLSLIIDSQRTTEIFTAWELQFMLTFFCYNINTSNPSTRQQIIAFAKKAFQRSCDSFAVLTKNGSPQSKSDDEKGVTKNDYVKFWHAMLRDVLLPGLNPDCNYGRRSTCLELLQFTFEHMNAIKFTPMWCNEDLNNLKYIVQSDTYERNKDLAAQLLNRFPPECLGFNSNELMIKHVEECLSLAVSIKPAQTISAAYMLKAGLSSPFMRTAMIEKILKTKTVQIFDIADDSDAVFLLLIQLICELEHCYTIGKRNLQEAAASRPIHGFVFSIRHLLKTENLGKQVGKPAWRMLIKDLLTWCFRLSELVKTIICNQSPEGYLPEDSDSDNSETDETAKAQMVTVYGWRAAKEISLLLGEIALKAPFYDDTHLEGLIDQQQLKQIGDYFFYLLINTKHRGAFEQASLGFSNLTTRLWRVPNASINKLPSIWLQKILNILLGVGEETMETCATRRSAGVPFMVQAILVTEPNTAGSQKFGIFMKLLLNVVADIARPDEHRIHCLNILRTLYRHNQLSDMVAPYCGQGLMISIQGFGSKIWGIRNSATLLFSALLIRIFGVPRTRDIDVVNIKNKMMAQVFFARYPELYGFLLEEFGKAAINKNSPSLFPILLILSRLYCSADRSNTYQLDEYFPHVEACSMNPVYRIRDLAAKTCVNLLQPLDIPKQIVFCFIQLSNITIPDVYCHGMLLQIHYLLQVKHYKPFLNVAKVIEGTAWILLCCSRQISHLTATLYLETITDIITQYDLGFQNCEIFKRLLALLQWQTQQKIPLEQISTAKTKYNIYLFNLKLCSILHIVQCPHCHVSFEKITSYEELIVEDLKCHKELRNMCLSYIHYLNFCGLKFEHHNVHEDIDSEYSELIDKTLKPLDCRSKAFLHEVLKGALEKIKQIKCGSVFGFADRELLEIYTLHHFTDFIQNKQELLNFYISFCNTTNERTVCSSIAYLDNFLNELTDEEVLHLDFNKMIDVVFKFCLPSAEFSYRIGMTRLLVHNKKLYYGKKRWILSWSILCVLWEVVFLLLEDDEEEVRNMICQLCQQDLTTVKNNCTFIPETKVDIPEYARDLLLSAMVDTMPTHCSIDILLSWILRGKDVTRGNLSEVFDEGELNTHVEIFSMAKASTQALYKMLWTLHDGINFNDKSIFIEEQSLLIATTLYDKIYRNVVPLVKDQMNIAVRNILVRVIMFLEKVVVNKPDFKSKFREVVNGALQSDTVKLLDASELIRLKMFLGKVFNLFLWQRIELENAG